MKEPVHRFWTDKAIQTLAKEFGYPNDHSTQDWGWEVARLTDSNGTGDFDWVARIWPQVRQLLVKDIRIHEYTIYRWCCFDCGDIKEAFFISPRMRELVRTSRF